MPKQLGSWGCSFCDFTNTAWFKVEAHELVCSSRPHDCISCKHLKTSEHNKACVSTKMREDIPAVFVRCQQITVKEPTLIGCKYWEVREEK